MEEVDVKAAPPPHHSEKNHTRSALEAACAPCRQAEQKGGGERKRLTAGLLCCHSDCLCIESIERRFLRFGIFPVFSPLLLSDCFSLSADFKPLCQRCVKGLIKPVTGHLPTTHGCGRGLKGHVSPTPSPPLRSAGRGKIGLNHSRCRSAEKLLVMATTVMALGGSSGRLQVTEVTSHIKTSAFFLTDCTLSPVSEAEIMNKASAFDQTCLWCKGKY